MEIRQMKLNELFDYTENERCRHKFKAIITIMALMGCRASQPSILFVVLIASVQVGDGRHIKNGCVKICKLLMDYPHHHLFFKLIKKVSFAPDAVICKERDGTYGLTSSSLVWYLENRIIHCGCHTHPLSIGLCDHRVELDTMLSHDSSIIICQ